MRIFVVVGVYGGVAEDAKAFKSKKRAEAEYDLMLKEYDIVKGEEEQSENDVKLFEVEVG